VRIRPPLGIAREAALGAEAHATARSHRQNPGVRQDWPSAGRLTRVSGVRPKIPTIPVCRGAASGRRQRRTRECTPSAPTRISPTAADPSWNRAVTPPSRSSYAVNVLPKHVCSSNPERRAWRRTPAAREIRDRVRGQRSGAARSSANGCPVCSAICAGRGMRGRHAVHHDASCQYVEGTRGLDADRRAQVPDRAADGHHPAAVARAERRRSWFGAASTSDSRSGVGPVTRHRARFDVG
jgi:hypothetical protein